VEAEDEGNDEDDGQPQQEMNCVAAAAALTAERLCDTHLSDKEDRRQRPADQQRLLPSRDPSSEPSHNKAGSDNAHPLYARKSPALRLKTNNVCGGLYFTTIHRLRVPSASLFKGNRLQLPGSLRSKK
jgi:hypothetical protein